MREISSVGRHVPVKAPPHASPRQAHATPEQPQESYVASGKSASKASSASLASPASPASSHAAHKASGQASAHQAAAMILGAGLGVAIVGPHDRKTKELAHLVEDVRACLSDELRKPPYQGNPNPMAGHCYVASEAIYHHLGGKEAGWKPMHITHEGGPHWYLSNADGLVVDPTADQFKTPVPYEEGKGMGFLTREPSKRAQTVLDRLEERQS